MHSRSLLFILLSGLFLSIAGFHTYKIVENTYKYVYFKEKAIAVLDFEKRLFNKDEWKYSIFQRSWAEDEARIKIQTFSDRMESSIESYRVSIFYSVLFIIDSAVFLILTVLLFFKSQLLFKFIVLALVIMAFLCLYVGILAPMIEISAYRTDMTIDIPIIGEKIFKGDVYFYYQCKSISDLITLLLKNNNIIVGSCILAFSVIFPLTKLSMTSLVLYNYKFYENQIVSFVINKIGKWSMADVFVAAIFLSFLSFRNLNTSIETKSETLLGLYFFLSYCMLSLISSHLTEKTNIYRNKAKLM